MEVRERGSMDFVVVMIHRVHRKAACFHQYYKMMLREYHFLWEQVDVWVVPVVVH